MSVILGLFIIVCIVLILVGLVKPGTVIRWGKPEKRGRGKVILYYGLALIILFFVIGSTAEETDSVQQAASKAETNLTEAAAEETAVIEETVEAAEPVVEAETAANNQEAEEKRLHPEWNTAEPDAMENGNLALALDMLQAMQEMPAGEPAVAQEIIKTPWNYYGVPVLFSGVVGIAEDYPPDSDTGKVGVASDIVIESDDGTIVEFFSMVPSGVLQVGDYVSITGYPIGRTEVENAMGGNYTHLIVVTNRL